MSPMLGIELRFALIYQLGCLCCVLRGWHNPCQIHHLNMGGHAGAPRLGDYATIGLCPWHHQGQADSVLGEQMTRKVLGPSLALEPNKFRKEFGSDEDLLRAQDAALEMRAKLRVGHEDVLPRKAGARHSSDREGN